MNEQELRAEFEREFLDQYPHMTPYGVFEFNRAGTAYLDDTVAIAYEMWKRAKLQSDARIAELESQVKYWKNCFDGGSGANRKLAEISAELKAENERLKATSVPKGWKLVPIELTQKMWLAGWSDATNDQGLDERFEPKSIWSAILAAAPQPQKDE